jgi:putative membrane protein
MIVTEHVIRDVVVILVAILALAFVWGYWLPSWRLGRLLRRVIPAIRLLRTGEEDIPVLRERVSDILGADRVLGHLWGQYAETLHLQYEAVDGENRLRKIRATVPADAFFSSHVVVDACLNSEFFRHLPGLLTGIGIIGTFLGLILGLAGFEPTGSGEAIKASLGALMQGVMEAFTASAIAIAMAMLITLVEKQQLNRRATSRWKSLRRRSTRSTRLVPERSISPGWSGPARESATQTRLLKQSLVEDLRQILTDLTERQDRGQAIPIVNRWPQAWAMP